MSIQTSKFLADKLAEEQAVVCFQVSNHFAPAYKFFRKLAGLSGNDLRKDKDVS